MEEHYSLQLSYKLHNSFRTTSCMSEIVKAFFLSTYIAQSIIEDQSWLRLDGNRSFQIYAFYGFYRRDLGAGSKRRL